MVMTPPQVKNDPKHRLYVLVFLMVGVVLAMQTCHVYYQAPSTVPSPAEQKMIVADDKPVADGEAPAPENPLPGVPSADFLDTEHMRGFVANDDKNIRDAVDLSLLREVLTPAFGWLKTQPHEVLAEMAHPRRPRPKGPVEWNYYKVMQNTDDWRFQMIHVYGMLVDAKTVDLEDMPPGLRRLFRLTLYDHGGHNFYTILTPLMPADAKVLDIDKQRDGSFVAADGMLIMRFPYVAVAGWQRTPLFLARRVVLAQEGHTPSIRLDERGDPGRTYRDIRPTSTTGRLNPEILERLFAPPRQGVDAEGMKYRGLNTDLRAEAHDLRNEWTILAHVFKYVWHFSDAELKEKANPALTYRSLMAGAAPPGWMRGQVARFEGRAGSVQPWRLEEAPESGIDRFYVITAYDSRLKGFQFTWALATLNLPEGLRHGDAIEAEGVFLKLYPYRTPDRKWHWSPLIVCKSVRRIPPAPPPYRIYLIMAFAVAGLLGVMYWASQRDTAKLGAMRARSQERRVAFESKQREQGLRPPTAYPPKPGPDGGTPPPEGDEDREPGGGDVPDANEGAPSSGAPETASGEGESPDPNADPDRPGDAPPPGREG